MINVIKPIWPAPHQVKAYTTLRTGGVSPPPYDSFNLAFHTGDEKTNVEKNRENLKKLLNLPSEPIWINQTHSTITRKAEPGNRDKEADAAYTDEKNCICIVLTADCLPILICNKQGTHCAAVHAGWRGLADGVIESALQAMNLPAEDLLVWLGPAIGPNHFEVKEDVRNKFLEKNGESSAAFHSLKNGAYLANLYLLAKIRLEKAGIQDIYGGGFCTFSESNDFFSYRRDGEKTGRMATLIYIQ